MNNQILSCLIFICLISCQKSELSKNALKMEIINSQINSIEDPTILTRTKIMYNMKERNNAKNIITYKLSNNSKDKYFFVLDEDLIEVANEYDLGTCLYCTKSKLFYNIEANGNVKTEYFSHKGDTFIKSNDKFNPEVYKIEETRYKLEELNYSSPKYDYEFCNSIRKNSFVLYPNQTKYFQIVVYLPMKEINNYNNVISYFIFKDRIKYNFDLIYMADSILIKKNLPWYKLKELQENNVKVFHGKLISNKVPIVRI